MSRAGSSTDPDDDTAELVARLTRYPISRYPVQHATTAFHLATVFLQSDLPDRLDRAVPLLSTAYDTFGRLGMRLEQTKALTMHGVALREGGRSDLAMVTFERAAAAFGELEQPVEQAAASYNLGLSLLQHGDPSAAHASLIRAHDLFLEAGQLAQAGSAARERATNLLTSGKVDAAIVLLDDAAELADRAGDMPGLGAASNALGLAHLAADDPAAAVREFSRAVGAYPRSMRPTEHAMAKANLAMAHERVGNVARARLAARQALAIPHADQLVLEQAQGLLERLLGGPQADLLAVLDEELAEQWFPIVREEVLRWCEAPRAERVHAICEFLAGVLSRAGASYGLGESLLAVMLELPPAPYDDMVAGIVWAAHDLHPAQEERVRAVLGSALARFAIPQWQRLAASLNAAAAAAGLRQDWR